MKNLSGKTGKRITVFTLCVVLVALFATNCEKLRELRVNELAESLSKIPITATDYSLENSGCSWNFANMVQDSVCVINSKKELMSFIIGSSPPSIDFTENTLLLVHGNNKVSNITKNVQWITKNKEYKLDIKVLLGDTTIPQQWCVALLVPKTPQDAIVTLNMMYSCEDTIAFINYPLGYKFSLRDTLYVINSNMELLTLWGNIPDSIDFSIHTLLYTCNMSPYQPPEIIDSVLLRDYCTDQYTLNLSIDEGPSAMPMSWYFSILVPKITKTNSIITQEKKYDVNGILEIKYTF